MAPEIRYAKSGDVHIAYQVIGEGELDLVFVPAFVSNIGLIWAQPRWSSFLSRLSSFSRLILFDKRGTGLSDRPRDVPTLESRMDDVRAILDAVGSERAGLLGDAEGSRMATLFAATYPERTIALALFQPQPKALRSPDYPWGRTEDELRERLAEVWAGWGSRDFFEDLLRHRHPALADDPQFTDWFVEYMRQAVSPGAAAGFFRMMGESDVTDVLPSVRLPTLVLYRRPLKGPSVFVAERIPGAIAVELTGAEYGIFERGEEVALALEQFFARPDLEVEPTGRVLATVLFTDIVGSTEQTSQLGDRAWRELLERHHALVRHRLSQYRGEELDSAGDGFFATFDGPGRAIACARILIEDMRSLGLGIRAGLHTGECERIGTKLTGIAVSVGARVAGVADAGQVLVSSTVKDLVAGSSIEFEDRGTRELKGVPGEWHLFAVKRESVA